MDLADSMVRVSQGIPVDSFQRNLSCARDATMESHRLATKFVKGKRETYTQRIIINIILSQYL